MKLWACRGVKVESDFSKKLNKMLEEPLCDDEYEYYTDEDEEADIEDEAGDHLLLDNDCWYLLPQDEDDTLKSSNSVPDVPGPVRKDSAWRRKFDEEAMDTLLTLEWSYFEVFIFSQVFLGMKRFTVFTQSF